MARLPGPEDLGQRPTPNAPGGIAQYRGDIPGLEAAGTAQMNLGRTMSAVGDELWHEQNRLDTIKAEEAFNDLRRRQLDLTIGQKGFTNLKGGDAVQPTYFPSYMAEFGRAEGEVANTLTNDRQKELFKRRAEVAAVEFKGSLLNHAVQQGDAMAKATTQATVDTEIANIAANPLDDGKVAFSNLRISEALASENKRLGIPNDSPIALEQAQKVQDAAWQKRIDAVLYSDPIRAEQLFKANEKQITNPALRLQLQHQVREASLSVSAGIEAQRVIDQTRTEVEPKTRAPRPAGEVEVGFNGAVESLLKREGGYKASDGKSGAPVNFGINQKANPDIDVAKLTKEQAKEIYRKRYWDAIGGDSLPPATAVVALDAAALQGTEVAKKLIMDSDGDPQAMIDIRRGQLKALAARDPEQAKYLPQWLKRMDGLEAQVSGMQNVAYHPDDPTAQNTSGLPNSRDLAAQLPMMEGKVEARATELYGADPANPDRAAFARRMKQELHAKVASDVQQLNSIQRQAQGALIDAIVGARAGGVDQPAGAMTVGGQGQAKPVLTAFSQVQADPQLMRAWQMLDPGVKPALLNLMDKNRDKEGDVVLFRKLFNRIHLEPGDPAKIDYYKQIVDPAVADRLSIAQISTLRAEIDRSETPGGRSLNQMRKAADANVSLYFKTNIMFTAQPERQIAATMRWNEDAAKKVDEYVAAKKDVRSLFMLDTQDSIVSQKYLQTYVNSTPAQGLADQAAKAQTIPQPKTEAEYNALPPGSLYLDPNNKQRQKPGQAPAQTLNAPQAAYGTRADGTQKGTGYFGELPAAGGKVSTEISVGVNIGGKEMEIPTLVPTLSRPEIDHLLAGQAPTKEIVNKAVAYAKTRIAAGKEPFAGPGEQVTPPPPAPEDDIPKLEDAPTGQKGYRTQEQKDAQTARAEAGRAEMLGWLKAGIRGGVYVATYPLRMVAKNIVQATELVPSEEERVVSAFRGMLKKGTYRATEDTFVLLNNFLASNKGTAAENAKAQKMVKAIADKLGIDQTPPEAQ